MIDAIAEKVRNDERLTSEEGIALLTSDKADEVTALADETRRRKVGDTVYYASTVHIQPTNLCELSCPMCSFYAKPGWKKAWFLTPDQAMEKVEKGHETGLTEVHVVGGLWRDCDLSYYQELFTRIKALDSEIHIKALTPVEYDFLAKLHGLPVEEVLGRMMEWGLGSLPGGGAEILVEEIRKQVAPQKITSEEYLEIHKVAHRLGLPSNVTMLFGHVEGPEHIIAHLCKVRELQDETGGVRTFVPLKYHTENNALGKRANRLKPPKDLALVYAVSRLMLDNVRNLKVLWKYVGLDTAKQLLSCGGNDLSSTYDEEMIIELAGSIKEQMTSQWIDEIIREIGREPMLIHSGHHYEEELVLV